MIFPEAQHQNRDSAKQRGKKNKERRREKKNKQESWVEGVYVKWRKEDVLKEMHEKIKREWSVLVGAKTWRRGMESVDLWVINRMENGSCVVWLEIGLVA